MSKSQRRAVLYGAGIVAAAGLLFAGYGISVPPDPGVRLNGATLLAGAGQYDQALEICDIVLREHPDSLDARVFKATFLSMAGRHDAAVAAYDDALAHVGDRGEEMRRDLILDRASILLSAGRHEEFRRECDRLARLGSDHRSLVLEGMAAAQAENWDAAVEAYRGAHERRPLDEPIKARLWNALVEQGQAALAARRFEKAQQAFDAAQPLFPSARKAHLMAIEVRLALGDPEDALRRSRALGPDTPGIAPLLFRAATALLEAGNRPTALDALAAALEADPGGTRALLDKESAWNACRDDPDVRRILETRQIGRGHRLPAQERVIDSQGAAPIRESPQGGRNSPRKPAAARK
ncbi:MAG: tetratricopeptide repeat protein [Planctomycetota bacterium]|jgi:tetratricopeptide (TPR) repeat protein